MVLTIPDMGDRYFMMPMLSGWTDVFQSPGTRTTGQKPQKYIITGPGWSGTLPTGVTEYKSPTGVCTENRIRVDDVMEWPKLAG